jgi:hypothetical protein
VSDEHDALQVEVVLRSERAEMIDRAAYIEMGVRPSTSRLSDTAVFDIPRCDPRILECISHGGKVASGCVLRLEASSMYEYHDWMRRTSGRETQFAVLARVLPVGDAVIRWTDRQRLESHRTHELRGARGVCRGRCRTTRTTGSEDQYDPEGRFDSHWNLQGILPPMATDIR